MASADWALAVATKASHIFAMLSARLLSIWVIFWVALVARGQDGQPDAFVLPATPNGSIEVIVSQRDGKALIAGSFTSIGSTARGRVARLNLDGSLDTTFAIGAGANGTVRAIAVQTDGKILIGGDFTSYNGTTCGRIARLNTDGGLDGTFSAGSGANGAIHALLYDTSSASIVVGGDFTTFAGSSRTRIARLSQSGSLVSFPNFGAGANGAVRVLASLDSGTIIAGGDFTSFSGVTRNRLAVLSIFSGSLTSFNSTGGASGGPNGAVRAIWVSGSTAYIGGDFTAVSGTTRTRLAALDSTGALVTTFSPAADGSVRALLGTVSGTATKLVAAGDFTQINTTTVGRIARLDSSQSWALDTAFAGGTGADATVRSVAAMPDGKLLAAGDFMVMGGAARPAAARLYGLGGTNPPDIPPAPTVGAETDSKLGVYFKGGVSYLIGYKIERSTDLATWTEIVPSMVGNSLYIDTSLAPGAMYHYRFRAFNSNGVGEPSASTAGTTLTAPWDGAGVCDAAFSVAIGTGVSSYLNAVVVQPDGKIIVAGSFSSFAGTSRPNIARLLPDGTIDVSFNPGTGPNGTIEALAVQGDGKILIGGSFTTVGGLARNRVARLLPDGGVDTGFAPVSGADSTVMAVAAYADGKLVIGGRFSTVNGAARAGIARLASDGSLDPTFDPGSGVNSAGVYTLVVQPDGKVVVGGFFQRAAGVSVGNMARFNADGSLDTGFGGGEGASSWIEDMRLMPDGRIVIVGPFSTYNDVSRPCVARLLPDGQLDTTFAPGAGLSRGWAEAVEVQPDGRVIAGGWFSLANDKLAIRIARFLPDGTVDASFMPGQGASSDVLTLALQPDGKCLAGGYFSTFGESNARGLCRLLGDGGSVAPVAPATAGASALSSTSLRLTWPASSWVSGYIVERSLDGVANWAGVAVVGARDLVYDATGLLPGTSYVFRIRAYSTNGESTGSATAGARTYSRLEQWKLDQGLSAAAADGEDADGDGLPNLMEYALGSSPVSADSANFPVVSAVDGRLILAYRRLRDELTYTVESSADLQNWSASDVDQGGAGTEAVASTPIDGARKFLRLKVGAF